MIDADKLRKLLSGMIQNQLLKLSDNVYKPKEKDAMESVFPEISETETLLINETWMTPKKHLTTKLLRKKW